MSVHPRRCTRAQRGALSVWFAATAATCALMAFVVFDVGAISVGRQRLADATDAAAFSGATAQARALNFAALSNRTIIANEVFIAQVVSFDSWLRYAIKFEQNVGLAVTGFFPALIAWLVPLDRLLSRVGDSVSTVGELAVSQTSGIDLALAGAVDLALLATPATAQALAAATLQANPFSGADGQIDHPAPYAALQPALAAHNAAQFAALTHRYAGRERSRAAEVVLDSRDHFSQDRPGHALLNVNIGIAGLSKSSGGTLLKQYDRWEAQDTLEAWSIDGALGGPIAWGRAVDAAARTRGDYWCGPNVDANTPCTRPTRWSWTWAWISTDPWQGFRGIPVLHDVAAKGAKDPAADFIVASELTRDALALSDAQQLATASGASAPGTPAPGAHLAGNRLQGLARARVAFVRPTDPRDSTASHLVRTDGATEYASLFNPYWQARLAPLTHAQRAAWLLPMGVPPARAFAEELLP
jgi:hypothetical protein